MTRLRKASRDRVMHKQMPGDQEDVGAWMGTAGVKSRFYRNVWNSLELAEFPFHLVRLMLTSILSTQAQVPLDLIEPELVTHIATVHEAVGAGDQIFLDVDRVDNSIPSALSNHSPESEDIAFDTTLTDLNPQFLDKFLANLNPDSFSTLFPDSGSNFRLQEYYYNHGFSITQRSEADEDGLEYIAPPTENFNQSGLSASQELPPLPAPPLAPSPSPAELEEPVNNPVDGGPDHIIAPRDIDLDLNERNIVSGKRQRTQSTRAADMAVSRPAKRGPHASRKDQIQLDWEK
ncbi:hypothetical protein DFH08DRAFT_806344 [Mycena albidolilacea]|uniref:Uncharacterized protein n=1 Tax=Mycena albidolilacea TaxID=1033008 RepID=A0AAD7A8W7_9AGAR|nr:hypothetical protein DFH08DRAFT_806344 [Mycena albidolilacea]